MSVNDNKLLISFTSLWMDIMDIYGHLEASQPAEQLRERYKDGQAS